MVVLIIIIIIINNFFGTLSKIVKLFATLICSEILFFVLFFLLRGKTLIFFSLASTNSGLRILSFFYIVGHLVDPNL